jgi:hypothetical protein
LIVRLTVKKKKKKNAFTNLGTNMASIRSAVASAVRARRHRGILSAGSNQPFLGSAGTLTASEVTPLLWISKRNFDQTRHLAEMAAPDVMLGKWRLTKSENFDDYLKCCG